MELKKLLTSAIAAGSLMLAAACGDDGDNGPVDGECPSEAPACDLADILPQPAAGCLAEAGELEPTNFRVTSISIPAPAAAVGFDLDCFNTKATDAFGCMKPDRGEGVDNALASINQLLGALSINLNQQISTGIGSGYNGEIRFNVVVQGYDGADDDCVVVGLEAYNPDTTMFEPAAEPVAAAVEGGVLKAAIASLPLVIPFDDDMGGFLLLQVNVDNARVELPIGEVGISGGIIGGHVIWDDGSDGDLASLVQSVIDSLGEGASIDFATAANIIVGQLDMYVEGASDGPCDCQAISVGIEIGAEAEDEPPPV
jgi:hypothetical protein